MSAEARSPKPSPRQLMDARSLGASMSMRTRLRVFIILLMVAVISALSYLHLQSITWTRLDEVGERADRASQQVLQVLRNRITTLSIENNLQTNDLEEIKRSWTRFIEGDPDVSAFIRGTLRNNNEIAEILVTTPEGRILVSSTPTRVGSRAEHLQDFKKWSRLGHWRKLSEVLWQTRDYEVVTTVGFSSSPDQPALFTIRLILPSVFLRRLIYPQVESVLQIFLGATLLSMVLAVVVSNLALRPLQQLSLAIDQIVRGEPAHQSGSDSTAREYQAVQSKLTLLGQQYHGARQDAIQLRSNVEQLLEKLEETVLLFDGDDRLVMAGRAAERLLGRGRWELVGQPMTDVFPASTPLGVVVRNAIDLRQPVRDLSLTLTHAGAEGMRALVNVEILESFPDHQRIGTLITLRDAETRRQIQSQLDVSARLAAISRLTGGVAHEIKNPLQAITVHLEVLKGKLADQYDEVGPAIETIAREIQRLDRVVKTFLDFTRPIDLRMREFEIVSTARDVAKLVEPSASRQSVTISFHAQPEQIRLVGDSDLIQQALLNVVVNGVEAMKQGGRLDIRVEQSGPECVVSVTDEGVGIPPEIRDKIFNLYYSTKGKGSGIGLAMTFRVVQLHNGTIDFSSEPGKGTTFRLRFPAAASDSAGAVQRIQPAEDRVR